MYTSPRPAPLPLGVTTPSTLHALDTADGPRTESALSTVSGSVHEVTQVQKLNFSRFQTQVLQRELRLGVSPQQPTLKLKLLQLLDALGMHSGVIKGSTVQHVYDNPWRSDLDLQLPYPEGQAAKWALEQTTLRCVALLEQLAAQQLPHPERLKLSTWVSAKLLHGPQGELGVKLQLGYKQSDCQPIDVVMLPGNAVVYDTLTASDFIGFDIKAQTATRQTQADPAVNTWLSRNQLIWINPEIAGGMSRFSYHRSKRPDWVFLQPNPAQLLAHKREPSEQATLHQRLLLNPTGPWPADPEDMALLWQPVLKAVGICPTPEAHNKPAFDTLREVVLTQSLLSTHQLQKLARGVLDPTVIKRLQGIQVNANARRHLELAIEQYPLDTLEFAGLLERTLGVPLPSGEQLLQSLKAFEHVERMPKATLQRLCGDLIDHLLPLSAPATQVDLNALRELLGGGGLSAFHYSISRIAPQQRTQGIAKKDLHNVMQAWCAVQAELSDNDWIHTLQALEPLSLGVSEFDTLVQNSVNSKRWESAEVLAQTTKPNLLTLLYLEHHLLTTGLHGFAQKCNLPVHVFTHELAALPAMVQPFVQQLFVLAQAPLPSLRCRLQLHKNALTLQLGPFKLQAQRTQTQQVDFLDDQRTCRLKIQGSCVLVYQPYTTHSKSVCCVLPSREVLEGQLKVNNTVLEGSITQSLTLPGGQPKARSLIDLCALFFPADLWTHSTWDAAVLTGKFKVDALQHAAHFEKLVDALEDGKLERFNPLMGFRTRVNFVAGSPVSMQVESSPEAREDAAQQLDAATMPIGLATLLSLPPNFMDFSYWVPLLKQPVDTATAVESEVIALLERTQTDLYYMNHQGMVSASLIGPYDLHTEDVQGWCRILAPQQGWRWEGMVANRHALSMGALYATQGSEPLIDFAQTEPTHPLSLGLLDLIYRLHKPVPLQRLEYSKHVAHWEDAWPDESHEGFLTAKRSDGTFSFIGYHQQGRYVGTLKAGNQFNNPALACMIEGSFTVLPSGRRPQLQNKLLPGTPAAGMQTDSSGELLPHGLCRASLLDNETQSCSKPTPHLCLYGLPLMYTEAMLHHGSDQETPLDQIELIHPSNRLVINIRRGELTGGKLLKPLPEADIFQLQLNHRPGVDRLIQFPSLAAKPAKMYSIHLEDADGFTAHFQTKNCQSALQHIDFASLSFPEGWKYIGQVKVEALQLTLVRGALVIDSLRFDLEALEDQPLQVHSKSTQGQALLATLREANPNDFDVQQLVMHVVECSTGKPMDWQRQWADRLDLRLSTQDEGRTEGVVNLDVYPSVTGFYLRGLPNP